MSKITAVIKSSKGFYVGDICYVLSDRLYSDVWGDKYGYEDGVVVDPVSKLSFAVAGTAYGDGAYSGSNGNCFSVDAGVIGIVPLELVEKDIDSEMTIVNGAGSASFTAENGLFSIDFPDGEYLEINTDDEEDYDYDEDEYEEV